MKSIKTDWRYQNQEEYLNELEFKLCDYIPKQGNDHDHCEFCSSKFSNILPGSLKCIFSQH